MDTPGDGLDVDLLLDELGGCGRFQIGLAVVLFLAEMPASLSLLLMAFGYVNPGWQCLDQLNATTNANDTIDNGTTAIHDGEIEWKFDECAEFEACRDVEFNPDSFTVVSEWGLLCDRNYIPSVIISIQMSGMLIGAYVTGYLGDKFGRKRTFCLQLLVSAVFNSIAYFSTSWQMLAVTRFFIGSTHSCITLFPFFLVSEIAPHKWRSVIVSLPAYAFGTTLFAICAMLLRDWRQIQLVTAIITGVCFLPTLWAPESIRWLRINRKKKEFIKVLKTIAKVNKKSSNQKLENLDITWEAVELKNRDSETVDESRKYSWRNLWRGRACKPTILITPIWFTMALTYYALSFGIKSLTGDFYTNFMVSSLLEFPVFFMSSYAPNLLGRKNAMLSCCVFNAACLIALVFINRLASLDVRGLATLILVLTVKVAVSAEWYILRVIMSELYPTVIRATSQGYGTVIARVGGIVAPYFIPNNPETYFISFSIMAGLMLLCCLFVSCLPETNGTNFMDTWEVPVEKHVEMEPLSGDTKEGRCDVAIHA